MVSVWVVECSWLDDPESFWLDGAYVCEGDARLRAARLEQADRDVAAGVRRLDLRCDPAEIIRAIGRAQNGE